MAEITPKVTILPETTRKPITLIGKRAGICWNANVEDDERNYKRGLECLENNHGRTLEYVNVEMLLSGISCRLGREWYVHIGGAPSRLQASSRYIKYSKGFDYVIPDSIKNNEVALKDYEYTMQMIADVTKYLEDDLKIPREDVANLFPLGMETTIVDKRNLRNLIDMSRQRMCSRAYWEYRKLFTEIMNELRQIDDEWAYIVDHFFMPKCEQLGYCPEKYSCGRKPKKSGDLNE